MTTVRLATSVDLDFLQESDRQVSSTELAALVDRQRVLVADLNARSVGWLRWGLFWDEIPFMNMLFVLESYRGCGVGRALVESWESTVAAAGHRAVMTSTLSNERAQDFYRHLNYVDVGCLLLPGEAAEIIFHKDVGMTRGPRVYGQLARQQSPGRLR